MRPLPSSLDEDWSIIAQGTPAANGVMFARYQGKYGCRLRAAADAAVLTAPLFLGFFINTTKAIPMSLTTWNMTLTARTDKTAVLGMRDYLRQ
ncbi:hypothetical protein BSZ22_20715 [Bradyrhizobium canariense]|uniref:Uncharacterized protein n=1 Tax=Bradyrhizobium canariense TaxID=255045 RepID=A0A1X3H381_9BRAD|nr:hypothetical protein BSZ22_20715 [Bradyrhizobium canariense]OSI78041.1 hypothetical protein BSZ23_19715 [Bradyrhizobium canariense]OSI89271.1 hypothetical protein BSZ25_21185 [Bradyrhizobium canariense]OSI93753.1 hypothetical protein BSZ24_12415 [Bradyrhizobium canariense]OSJ03070.1 hypothetical protein BSZ16_16610 [Bradyrhizobium canariense]